MTSLGISALWKKTNHLRIINRKKQGLIYSTSEYATCKAHNGNGRTSDCWFSLTSWDKRMHVSVFFSESFLRSVLSVWERGGCFIWIALYLYVHNVLDVCLYYSEQWCLKNTLMLILNSNEKIKVIYKSSLFFMFHNVFAIIWNV